MILGGAGIGDAPIGGEPTDEDGGVSIGVSTPIDAVADLGAVTLANANYIIIVDSAITALASINAVVFALSANPETILASAELLEPATLTNIDPAVIASVAVLGSPKWSVSINAQSISAYANIGAPEVAIVTKPAGISALAAIGTPTLAAVAAPYSIIGYAQLFPVLVPMTASGSTVLAINANTLAVSEYSIAALDVVEHEGEVWFVTATGLSKLADGAGVSGTITTGDLELSDGSISLNLTRLELEADGELHITATAHQDGGQRTTRYLVPKRTGTNERDRNVKLGNGVLGNDWSFTIAPPTGQVCNWSLGGWKIEPGQYKLRRR